MSRICASLVAISATFLATSLAAFAAPITVPSGLNPGDHYRLAFETSTTTTPASSDINTYNNFVNSLANAPGSPLAGLSTWTAIASTVAVDARDNTLTNPNVGADPSVPVYALNNTLIALNNAALWSGTLANPLDVTESGVVVPEYVWTGSASNGTAIPVSDLYNQYPLGAGLWPHLGSSQNATSAWIDYSYGYVGAQNSLYAISGVLTVAPEPSSIVLTAIATAGFALSSLRGRRRRKR
ncbi:MAG TPA: hypothetical protein VGJ26_02885 [Pirellulales bacterium]|jgi:hypothetical protein